MIAQCDDFRKMIEAAVKAPSGHNTQPWMFRMDSGKIEILPDLSKTLSAVDSDNRELFISLGCATENLCIAASALGYRSDVVFADNGTIDVFLEKSDSVTANWLFNQIAIRQTNRSVYEGKIIEEDTLAECLPCILPKDSVHIYCWKKDSPSFTILTSCVEEGNIIQMEDEEFVSELKSWMRYNKKDSESKMDGLSYAVFGAPNLPSFISKAAMGSFLNAKKQNKGDMKKIDSSSHFVLFTTVHNQVHDWIILGRYLQRFLLATTEANIAHSYMNQPCEVEVLRDRLKEDLPINKETPQLLLRIGYAEKAPYSKRKSIDEVIIK